MEVWKKVLITWGAMFVLMGIYGFIEIGLLSIEIRWILFFSWWTITIFGGLIWLWVKA